jgi:hypothetical protein
LTTTVQTSKATEADNERKNQLISLLARRESSYGPIVLKSVLLKEKAELRNCLTVLEALHKNASSPIEEVHDYPKFTLVKKIISPDQTREVAESLVTEGRLQVEDVVDTPFEGYFSPTWTGYFDSLPSNDEALNMDWPANTFLFEAKSKPGFPNEPYVTLNAPLFAGPWEVLRVWTGIDCSRYNQFLGSVAFVLPNYGARIEELRLSSAQLTIKVKALETPIDRIVGKLYCEKKGEALLQEDVLFEKTTAVIPITFAPDWWQVYLMSKDTGEVIDFRKVHATWPSLPPGVILELGAADLEEIVRRGENDRVEFKLEISKYPEPYIKTVVAFANTSGGTIIVGVEDAGQFAGVADEKFEERVMNQLRANCEPMPNVKVEKKIVQEKNIYLIHVPEGHDTPYNYKDRGVYIRAGSTDRLASRIELDGFYKKDSTFAYPTWPRA